MKQRGKSIILIAIIIVIIATITAIYYVKANRNQDEKTMRCIAEKSALVVKRGCSACAAQKEVLGEYLDSFEIIDCADSIDECIVYGITVVPTWIINGELYPNVKSIKELKKLTGC